jgi:RNA polymerase sigma factor (TIGR02999 family)
VPHLLRSPTDPLAALPMEASDRSAVVKELLERASTGDREAFDRLIPIVHDELRAVAHDQRRRWQGDQTLGTTVLVNEVYLRLASQDGARWESRSHLLAVASRAMRHILIDYARQRSAVKRGGFWDRVTLENVGEVHASFADLSPGQAETLVLLDTCLDELERESPRHARIVECRFFAGMTIRETADALGLSPATVKRGWSLARAWLHRAMGPDESAP